MDAKSIGRRLTEVARLPGRAVCVFGSEERIEGSVQSSRIDRCLARAVYRLSLEKKTPPIFFGPEAKDGMCPGAQAWCGVSDFSPMIKFFVSTGTPEFRHGEAEYLKPSPEAAERFFRAPGRIVLPFKYLNIAGWDQLQKDQKVLSFVLIGNAESIRNLGGLIQYSFEDIFYSAIMPGGPSCATMITYAAGLAEKAPKDTAFIGPVDPTGNAWFPPEMMCMALSFEMAEKMAENIDNSFIIKRAHIAFPVRRLNIEERW